ncbi:hypothetical protein [Neptunomonas sp. XY-337]|uniref:hypothetical protein n=1 Tax=Neptunomonas sp. XY-337 TaxID=2561897 RepID=UPI0010AB31BB|nr:hypothetical protein [Neptunomonas sp. XY-337]
MELSQGQARDMGDTAKADFLHWWYSVPVVTRIVLAVSLVLIIFSLYGSLVAPYIGWELPLVFGAFLLGKKYTDSSKNVLD